jgi:hypothetical protein
MKGDIHIVGSGQLARKGQLRVAQINAGASGSLARKSYAALPTAAANLKDTQPLHIAQQPRIVLQRRPRPIVRTLHRDLMARLIPAAQFIPCRAHGAGLVNKMPSIHE